MKKQLDLINVGVMCYCFIYLTYMVIIQTEAFLTAICIIIGLACIGLLIYASIKAWGGIIFYLPIYISRIRVRINCLYRHYRLYYRIFGIKLFFTKQWYRKLWIDTKILRKKFPPVDERYKQFYRIISVGGCSSWS